MKLNNCLTFHISLHRILLDSETCPCIIINYQTNSLCASNYILIFFLDCEMTCKSCFGTDRHSCINYDFDALGVLINNQC